MSYAHAEVPAFAGTTEGVCAEAESRRTRPPSRSHRANRFLGQEPRWTAWRVVLGLALTKRHDRAAHRGRCKSDHEAEEKQPQRDARRAVCENQVTQPAGIKPEQSADQQDRQRRTCREIDREQPEQGITKQIWAERTLHDVKSSIAAWRCKAPFRGNIQAR